jgi:hypothetical protein
MTELGRFLAEDFSVALAGAGTRFEVVDRIHLKSIIREHKLSTTGMIDPKTARKLGKIAGVQALITGTVTPFGDNVRITVKILDTETAKIIGASTANIAKTKAIEELLARGIETRSPYQQPTSSQYIPPPAGTNMSKKVGPLIITMKKITVLLKGRIDVTIAFSNSSDKQFFVGVPKSHDPNLTDDKANVYDYKSGLESDGYSGWRDRASTLFPKSQSNVTLRFRAEDRDIKLEDIGNSFAFSMRAIVLYSKSKSEGYMNVFFDGVKPFKPK